VYYSVALAVGDRWGCVNEYAEKHSNDCYIEFIPKNFIGVPYMEICRYELDFISQSMLDSVVDIGRSSCSYNLQSTQDHVTPLYRLKTVKFYEVGQSLDHLPGTIRNGFHAKNSGYNRLRKVVLDLILFFVQVLQPHDHRPTNTVSENR